MNLFIISLLCLASVIKAQSDCSTCHQVKIQGVLILFKLKFSYNYALSKGGQGSMNGWPSLLKRPYKKCLA